MIDLSRRNIVVASTTALLLLGCEGIMNAPSTSEIEKMIHEYAVEEASSGRADVLEIQKITKTDGFLGNEGRTYTADFTAKVKFKTCGYPALGKKNFDRFSNNEVFCRAEPGKTLVTHSSTIFGKGLTLEMYGNARFVNKESGWTLVRVNVKYDDPAKK